MSRWRVATTLETLLAEINLAAPQRSRGSDGGIGDAAHATRDSDHNPWVKDSRGVGVVRARDFTDDPAGGLDCNALADHLAALLGKHPGLGAGAYVIWNRRIISTSRLSEGWRSYSGSNPHTKHLHLSCGLAGYDSTAPYGWPPKPKKKIRHAYLRGLIRTAEKRAARMGLRKAAADLAAVRKGLPR